MSRALERRCPICDGKGIPVVYGLPGPKLEDAARRGKVALGGCVIGRADRDPNLHCPLCEHNWRSDEDPVLPDLSDISVDDGYF